MKPKILFLLAATLLTVNSVYADDKTLVPLNTYIKKNVSGDNVAKIYVYNRCSALFMMLTIQAKDQKDLESIKFTNNTRKAYMTMALAAADATSETFKNKEEASKQNAELVKKLEKTYQTYADNQTDLGKDLFEDYLIGGDLTTCSVLYKDLIAKK